MSLSRMHGDAACVHAGVDYLVFFDTVYQRLQPRSYFEVGTNSGLSLQRFACDAVCVDPEFLIISNVWIRRRRTMLYQMTSDDFFADVDLHMHFKGGPDVSFLDGMHRAEYLLRDFMNTERKSHRRSLVFMHDCLPQNLRMADRMPRLGEESEGHQRHFWTGDVWRVLYALQRFRPELDVRFVDCTPTGLVAISRLDPGNTVLDQNYDAAVRYMMSLELDGPRLTELWNMHPILDSAGLLANPIEVSALLNCR